MRVRPVAASRWRIGLWPARAYRIVRSAVSTTAYVIVTNERGSMLAARIRLASPSRRAGES